MQFNFIDRQYSLAPQKQPVLVFMIQIILN